MLLKMIILQNSVHNRIGSKKMFYHQESIVDTDGNINNKYRNAVNCDLSMIYLSGQTNATTCTRLTADSLQNETEANIECKDLVTSL